MEIGKREHLARQAATLRKASILTLVWAGKRLSAEEWVIPHYSGWSRAKLEVHLDGLRSHFLRALQLILVRPTRAQSDKAATWLAAQFDRLLQTGHPALTLCTVHEFEHAVGPLRAREHIETPPYGELYLQHGLGMAIRHPEYMLARDLGLLYGLYRDAEDLLTTVDASHPPSWALTANMNGQALARSVIIACFNLLESFSHGLARAYLMERPEAPDSIKEKLSEQRGSLQSRIVRIATAIKGECDLAPNKYPMHPLFGSIKQHRDAFVHCEPGRHTSRHGYVKEAIFHDVRREVVEETLDCTFALIRHVWHLVHEKAGPRWLPQRCQDGRFDQRDLHLSPSPPDPGGKTG